ncbi:MAG: putative signal transduction protein with EFhand domain [Caulobacteraceae bacterium]|nr:putative signal transduction protein with EFhand domain [Caulobacteraceae bacterium]
MSVGSISSSTVLQQLQQMLFSKADANGDGQLDPAEFASVGQNLPRGKNASGGTSAAQLLSSQSLGSLLSAQMRPPSPAAMFASADVDGDGKVSADELKAGMAKHAPPGADVSGHADKLLARLDTDGDGAISQTEFAAMKPPHGGGHGGPRGAGGPPKAAAGGSGQDQAYDPLDTNQDGTVSPEELAAGLSSVLTQLGNDLNADPLASLKSLLDKLSNNGDGAAASTVSLAA